MLSRKVQPLPLGGADPLPKSTYRQLLADARERTLELVQPVDEDDLDRVHHPLMSPLVWDLGHIAAFEDLWLCQRAGGLEALRPELSQLYDAAGVPRSDRGEIPYLPHAEAVAYMDAVRERALDVLDRADLDPETGDRLNGGGFAWEMLIQHEHQHNETMLQTLQLAAPGTYAPERAALPAPPPGPLPETVTIPAGPAGMGDPGEGFAYDNERPLHTVELPPYEIDATPVTNYAFSGFVADNGYRHRELWAPEGWAWRVQEKVERPLYWTPDGGERRFERVEDLDPSAPVMHVSWYEADAFARWRGARLPTEAEWERAAAWVPGTGERRHFPWGEEELTEGRANLDQVGFGPAPAGALPAGASATGVLGLLGDAWEWTASDFNPYPGFAAFPYREYSEVFFGGGYKVLRGGSWATRPRVARNTFRNWDYPVRRQIFTGFRCARDA